MWTHKKSKHDDAESFMESQYKDNAHKNQNLVCSSCTRLHVTLKTTFFKKCTLFDSNLQVSVHPKYKEMTTEYIKAYLIYLKTNYTYGKPLLLHKLIMILTIV